MEVFQNLELKHYFLILVALLFIIKKVMANNSFIRKYNLFISSFLLFALAILITVEFWGEKTWLVVVVMIMGIAVLFKVFYDILKK